MTPSFTRSVILPVFQTGPAEAKRGEGDPFARDSQFTEAALQHAP
jgi:hypothetical protein